jgi:hypothetical protein
MPTLAPLVREVTPCVVNISVHGRVKEENPLYRDPLFREFLDVPKQDESVSAPRVRPRDARNRAWIAALF